MVKHESVTESKIGMVYKETSSSICVLCASSELSQNVYFLKLETSS